jgi:hypothetical protein
VVVARLHADRGGPREASAATVDRVPRACLGLPRRSVDNPGTAVAGGAHEPAATQAPG